MTMGDSEQPQLAFSRAAVALMKGAVNNEANPGEWDAIINQRAHIADYMAHLGLELVVSDTDGYAYLKQREYLDGEVEIPRLIPRHQLSYPVSLLLVLLRKRILEHDQTSGEGRLIVSREQIVDMMRVFLKQTTNEAKLVEDVRRHVDKIESLGFIRKLRNNEDEYEVQRMLRSFVDAQWMSDMNTRLEEYRAYAEAGDAGDEGDAGATRDAGDAVDEGATRDAGDARDEGATHDTH